MPGWGIIGIGDIADTAMAPAIRKLGKNRLIGVVSRDQGRAEAFANRHNVRFAYTRYEDLLSNEDVDVVLITTPNNHHPEQVVEAARAGKHILCDKPLAPTVADAQRAIQACRVAGVKLGMNFQTRYFSAIQQMRRVIAGGGLGTIITVHAEASPGVRPLTGWRADAHLAGRGAVNNIAVHLYDVLRYLLGAEVADVAATFDRESADGLETLVLTMFRLTDGTLVYTNCNQSSPHPQNRIDICGSEGRLSGIGVTREDHGQLRLVVDGEHEEIMDFNSDDSWDQLVAAFDDAVIADREPMPSALDGLRSVQLVEAIGLAADEGRVVSVAY